MKKFILIVTFSLLLLACKSTGHCDAYGNKSAQTEELNFDISSSHTESMSKYTTTSKIK